MLSIYVTYCNCDLMIDKRNVFIRWFNESSETRPANGLTLDGAVVVEIIYYLFKKLKYLKM